jgi:hypothetical protein
MKDKKSKHEYIGVVIISDEKEGLPRYEFTINGKHTVTDFTTRSEFIQQQQKGKLPAAGGQFEKFKAATLHQKDIEEYFGILPGTEESQQSIQRFIRSCY